MHLTEDIPLTEEQVRELCLLFAPVARYAAQSAAKLSPAERANFSLKALTDEQVNVIMGKTTGALSELLMDDTLRKMKTPKELDEERKIQEQNNSRQHCLAIFQNFGLSKVDPRQRDLVLTCFEANGKAPPSLSTPSCAIAISTPEKCSGEDLFELSMTLRRIWEVVNSGEKADASATRNLFTDTERRNIVVLTHAVDAEYSRRRIQMRVARMKKSGDVEPAWKQIFEANEANKLFYPRSQGLVKVWQPKTGMQEMSIVAALGAYGDKEPHVYLGKPKFSKPHEIREGTFDYEHLPISLSDLTTMNNSDVKSRKELQDLTRILTATTPPVAAAAPTPPKKA